MPSTSLEVHTHRRLRTEFAPTTSFVLSTELPPPPYWVRSLHRIRVALATLIELLSIIDVVLIIVFPWWRINADPP